MMGLLLTQSEGFESRVSGSGFESQLETRNPELETFSMVCSP